MASFAMTMEKYYLLEWSLLSLIKAHIETHEPNCVYLLHKHDSVFFLIFIPVALKIGSLFVQRLTASSWHKKQGSIITSILRCHS